LEVGVIASTKLEKYVIKRIRDAKHIKSNVDTRCCSRFYIGPAFRGSREEPPIYEKT
jgi:hypothetical protein